MYKTPFDLVIKKKHQAIVKYIGIYVKTSGLSYIFSVVVTSR